MTTDTPHPVTLAIAGAAGRMGQRLCALAAATEGVQLVEAFDEASHPAIGRNAADGCDIPIHAGPQGKADAMIDFTAPAATRRLIELCSRESIAMVIGTTGLTDADQELIDEAARAVPILHATNFSRVVNVLNVLVAEAARMLGESYDIEIAETHHKHKKDAPSGTALTLAEKICDATGRDFKTDVVTSRAGDDCVRRPGEITVQALRLGDVVGEHTVMFGAPGERMELRHIGGSRDSYASGAIHAARWIARKKPGRYTMSDVLGL